MAMPPGQRPGASGPPAQPTPPSGQRAWPVRHPIWTGLIAIVALLLVAVAAASGSSPASTRTGSTSAAPSPHPSSTPTARTSALYCQAQAVSRRPADHTIVKIRIRTAARARVTVTGPLAPVRGESAASRVSALGTRTLRFRVGDAPPGVAVVMTVRVSRRGGAGSCQARLRPRPARVTAVAAPARPAAPAAPVASASPAPAPPSPASCYPLSNEGTCYEPGEFCRDDDHGMTGLAGDGETITCEDNDGWRWEPS
jgi:hypothetical protein